MVHKRIYEQRDWWLQHLKMLCLLSDRHQAIIKDRYGLPAGSPVPLDDVGRRYNVTSERIRQICFGGRAKICQFEKLLAILPDDLSADEDIVADLIVEARESSIQKLYYLVEVQVRKAQRSREPANRETRASRTGFEDVVIEELELAIRPYNVFKRAGMQTIGEICARSEKELLSLPNFGVNCL